MFISKEVKELAKDLVNNYPDWYFDRYVIYKNDEQKLWWANGYWYINFYPERGEQPRLNLIEKFVLSKAIKKCIKLNNCDTKESLSIKHGLDNEKYNENDFRRAYNHAKRVLDELNPYR